MQQSGDPGDETGPFTRFDGYRADFGGGPPERFVVDGTSAPRKWTDGQPAIGSDFIVCTHIQAVWAGHNLATPTTCSQTRF